MSRPLRIQYNDAWYHVMNRGRRSENIFLDKQDFLSFEKLLKESALQWGVRVAAYCLMSNHYHLLIQTPNANLSRFMRHLNGVYTQRFNRKHATDGQLFRGRYKSILIGEDNYLLELIQYIHFNPVRAEIVKKAGIYPWSSYCHYKKGLKESAWIYKDYVFKILGIKENYRSKKFQYFLKEDASDEIQEFYLQGNLKSVMGSVSFQEWVKNTYLTQVAHTEVPESKSLEPELKDIVDLVCTYYDIDPEVIFSNRRGLEKPYRDVAIYISRMKTPCTLVEIGSYFNNQKYSSISSAIQRVEKRINSEKSFKREIKQLLKS